MLTKKIHWVFLSTMLTTSTQNDSIQHPTNHLKHQTHHSWNMKIKDEKSKHQQALCKYNLTKTNQNTPSSSLPVWESEWSTPLLCAVKSLSCKLKSLKVFLKLYKDRNANFIEKNCSMDTFTWTDQCDKSLKVWSRKEIDLRGGENGKCQWAKTTWDVVPGGHLPLRLQKTKQGWRLLRVRCWCCPCCC